MPCRQPLLLTQRGALQADATANTEGCPAGRRCWPSPDDLLQAQVLLQDVLLLVLAKVGVAAGVQDGLLGDHQSPAGQAEEDWVQAPRQKWFFG